jgi:hypothetical protein
MPDDSAYDWTAGTLQSLRPYSAPLVSLATPRAPDYRVDLLLPVTTKPPARTLSAERYGILEVVFQSSSLGLMAG